MGPLHDTRIIEIAGLGACPFGCMVLADMGADVLRVDRLAPNWPQASLLNRNKRSIAIDLKSPAGLDVLLRLADGADVLAEGLRPGVAERLGFGPQVCLDRNPRLVYARMTGWGQEGPLAATAGHDIDYIAVSGALHLAGPPSGPPVPQANLVGDFGGGGMLMAVGVLAALLERGRSGAGQVVDAAMVDGSALLTTIIHELMAAGRWSGARGENLLDGGAPWYGVYETADGKYLAIGALEERFYEILTGLLDLPDLPSRDSPGAWPELRERLTAAFKRHTRAQWLEIFDGTDACVAPVLSPAEAPSHPHNDGRFVRVGDTIQPSPAPRFSRTPAGPPSAPVGSGADTDMVLASLGYDGAEISALRANGVVGLGDDDHDTEGSGVALAGGRACRTDPCFADGVEGRAQPARGERGRARVNGPVEARGPAGHELARAGLGDRDERAAGNSQRQPCLRQAEEQHAHQVARPYAVGAADSGRREGQLGRGGARRQRRARGRAGAERAGAVRPGSAAGYERRRADNHRGPCRANNDLHRYLLPPWTPAAREPFLPMPRPGSAAADPDGLDDQQQDRDHQVTAEHQHGELGP